MTGNSGSTALYELLNRAAIQHQRGQLAAAETLYREALAVHPGNADAHHNLGVLMMQQGRGPDIALPHFRQAWESNPAQPQYGLSYIKALGLIRQFDEARRVHADGLQRGFAWPPLSDMQPRQQSAAVAEPREGWRAHAAQRLAAGMLPEALEAWGRALLQRRDDHEALLGLARTLLALHRLKDAESAFQTLVSLRPQWPEAHCGHAEVLLALERTADAETAYRHALAIDPLHAQASSGLGRLLSEARRDAEAEELCRQILARDATRVDAHCNLGSLLRLSGRLGEAREHYARAVALQPDHLEARSALLFIEHYIARETTSLLEQSRAYGERVRARVKKPFNSWNCTPAPGVLRVGLVSGDLREHPVGYFLENLLAHHDPARIEWLAYPTFGHTDPLSERLRQHLKGWHPLVGLSDADAARRIRDDGVHVLLDLSGHTSNNRLPLFAWRPAPVAASWLGYFATTGVAAIDYLIADRMSVPEALAGTFTERLLYLPDTRLCFTPPVQAPQPAGLPAARKGFLTFGSFQAMPKITDAVLQVWSRILAQCPDARLRIQNTAVGSTEGQQVLRERLIRAGIDPAQVDMHGFSARLQYLEDCGEVDLILDTFPYPGGTTTCEALWMGVPTLTLCGETMIARQGASLLAAAGLEDWITDSEDAYVAQAVARAGNIAELAELRRTLRARLPATPLFDAARFARDMEQLLHQAWQETGLPRLRGKPPAQT